MTLSRRQFLCSAGGLIGAYALNDALRLASAAEAPAMAMPMKPAGMAMPTLAAPNVPLLNPT